MTATSLRDVYDDANTLVMPARTMAHATSSVIPIARSRDARNGASIQPIGAAVRGDAPVVIPRSRADQTTQPSRRYAADVKRYRRLSIGLAISLAFVLGITASLAVQITAHFTPAAARTPRDGITRSESMEIFDGVEAKVAPPPRPRRPVLRSPAPAATSAANTPDRTEPTGPTEPTEPSETTQADGPSDLAGRDLLGEGLSID